jgi:hypothetical protein
LKKVRTPGSGFQILSTKISTKKRGEDVLNWEWELLGEEDVLNLG